jgi:hypothetical protein
MGLAAGSSKLGSYSFELSIHLLAFLLEVLMVHLVYLILFCFFLLCLFCNFDGLGRLEQFFQTIYDFIVIVLSFFLEK